MILLPLALYKILPVFDNFSSLDQCHFVDNAIGPFAAMLYDMFSTTYTEILDVLYLSNHRIRWW
jgi:hypothetical protein